MYKQRLLEALRRIRDEGAAIRRAGICPNAMNRHGLCASVADIDTELDALFLNWFALTGQGSGSLAYPVSGSVEYQMERYNGTIWQNPVRLSLLHWLISQLEQELNRD